MAETTTALAPIEKAALAAKPPFKVSKAVLVDAMVLRLQSQNEEENKKRTALRDAARAKLENALLAWLKKNIGKMVATDLRGYHITERYGTPHVELKLPNPVPAELVAAYEEYAKYSGAICFDVKRTREEIRQSLDASPKAAELLKDKKMVTAIDTVLKEIGFDTGVTKTINA